MGAGPPNVNLGPLIPRKLLELEVEFKNTIRYGKVPALGTKIILYEDGCHIDF